MVRDFFLSQDTWTHYLYKVVLVGGFYYTGVRKRTLDDPLTDGYYGSPVTHKDKWGGQTPIKTILGLLWCEAGEQYGLECQHQTLCYNLNDPFCLNEHFGGGFSLRTCRKGGSIGAKAQVEHKIGIHGMTSEERSASAKKIRKNLSKETQEKMKSVARSNWVNLSESRKETLKIEAKQRATEKWRDTGTEERTIYMNPCLKAAKETNTRQWEVLFPSGILIVVSNLTEFCKEMGLTVSLMNKVSKGKRNHHKGYQVRKVPPPK
jgi:hypothetical protein